MRKKESSKRGYMTSREVNAHLKALDPKERISYLNKILSRKGLLAENTQYAVRESLAESYIGNGDLAKAQDAYMGLGNEHSNKGHYLEATRLGDKAVALAGKVTLSETKRIYGVQDTGERPGFFGRVLDALGMHDEAARIYEKQGAYEAAGDAYAKAGKGLDADTNYRQTLRRLERDINRKESRLREPRNRLEILSRAAVFLIALGLITIIPGIRGGVIGSSAKNFSYIFGACLFICGLICAFFYFRKKK